MGKSRSNAVGQPQRQPGRGGAGEVDDAGDSDHRDEAAASSRAEGPRPKRQRVSKSGVALAPVTARTAGELGASSSGVGAAAGGKGASPPRRPKKQRYTDELPLFDLARSFKKSLRHLPCMRTLPTLYLDPADVLFEMVTYARLKDWPIGNRFSGTAAEVKELWDGMDALKRGALSQSISNKLRVATRTAATKAAAEWSVSTAAVFVFRDVRDGLPEGFPSSGKVHSLMLDHDTGAIDLRKTQYKMIEKLMDQSEESIGFVVKSLYTIVNADAVWAAGGLTNVPPGKLHLYLFQLLFAVVYPVRKPKGKKVAGAQRVAAGAGGDGEGSGEEDGGGGAGSDVDGGGGGGGAAVNVARALPDELVQNSPGGMNHGVGDAFSKLADNKSKPKLCDISGKLATWATMLDPHIKEAAAVVPQEGVAELGDDAGDDDNAVAGEAASVSRGASAATFGVPATGTGAGVGAGAAAAGASAAASAAGSYRSRSGVMRVPSGSHASTPSSHTGQRSFNTFTSNLESDLKQMASAVKFLHDSWAAKPDQSEANKKVVNEKIEAEMIACAKKNADSGCDFTRMTEEVNKARGELPTTSPYIS